MEGGNVKVNNQVFLGLALLFLGCFIYIAFRSQNLVYHNWIEFFGVNTGFMHCPVGELSVISRFIVYNLPGGLYLASFGLLQSQIWSCNRIVFGVVFYSFSVTLIGSELLQAFLTEIGTFDLIDLIVYTVVAILFLPSLKNH